MEKVSAIDTELDLFLKSRKWYMPHIHNELTEAYNLGKKVLLEKVKDKAIIFAGGNTAETVIRLDDLKDLE